MPGTGTRTGLREPPGGGKPSVASWSLDKAAKSMPGESLRAAIRSAGEEGAAICAARTFFDLQVNNLAFYGQNLVNLSPEIDFWGLNYPGNLLKICFS